MNKLTVNPDYLSVSSALKQFIIKEKRQPVILCVGTDRITGDSLGPLTGHLLTTKYNVPAYVYGTLERPVTAKNLVETISLIKLRHPKDFIIAVDAALGSPCDIGVVKICKGGLEPGSALFKNLPTVGDYSVTAIVSGLDRAEPILLQDVRLHLVYSLAEAIAQGISESLRSMLVAKKMIS